MYTNAAQAYRARQAQGATPVQQVALLYDRAIASLREAIEAIDNGEIERRWRANTRAVEIIAALWSGLDMENGGEIAENLRRLYVFVMNRLRDVDLRNDAQAARDAIDILDPLRQSWHELARSHGRNAAHDPAAGAGQAASETPEPSAETLNLAT